MKGAEEHFKKKIEFVTKQMEKLQPVLQEKFKMKQGEIISFIFYTMRLLSNDLFINYYIKGAKGKPPTNP